MTHKDRLLRFGYELMEKIIVQNGGEIIVLEGSAGSPEEEMSKDVLSILTVLSARLYGKRSHQNRKTKELQI